MLLVKPPILRFGARLELIVYSRMYQGRWII